MTEKPVIAVIMPCFRETAHVLDVIGGIGDEVAHIIVVDDACPDKTGDFVEANCRDSRVLVLRHELNTGVGGATVSGYRRALELGCDIAVKVDGDGQMDPALIPTLVQPIIDGEADYTKGNRFHQFQAVGDMPAVRITGNMILSFASKLSSGYWDIFDTTNGFTAIHGKVMALIPLDNISKGYFFESDMLFRLGQIRAVVRDIPMQARYGTEKSALSIPKIIPEFLFKHTINTWKRIFHAYFVREFNVASIQLVVGKIMLLFGIVYGAYWWHDSIVTDVPASAGTVILAALPIILGSQLLINFLNFDTRNMPKTPLQLILKDMVR
ncbi:MAG: glycosyltransferase family 2 protein [Proteobacteria bacterium]|nr:glycosyltransferase family 2 protein [Pseudomonadota bacterium]MDA1024089.1 glycosyltransferase family 2 protein [Pseudomonadota bacterium]